jgi:hypothetical protein
MAINAPLPVRTRNAESDTFLTDTGGQLAATVALREPATHEIAAGLAAGSFRTTFRYALALIVVCFVSALFLPRHAAGSAVLRDKDAEEVTALRRN